MKINRKKREFSLVIEGDTEGCYVASVPALPGCHTQAKSLDLLMKRMGAAIDLCVEESGPGEEANEFIGVQRVAVG